MQLLASVLHERALSGHRDSLLAEAGGLLASALATTEELAGPTHPETAAVLVVQVGIVIERRRLRAPYRLCEQLAYRTVDTVEAVNACCGSGFRWRSLTSGRVAGGSRIRRWLTPGPRRG